MQFKLPKTPAVYVEGKDFKLADVDPDDITPFKRRPDDKADAEPRLIELRKRLSVLQELLYAEHKRSLLIVLQAMDTGGKDGAIENLLTGVNPAGVQVATFKAPSKEELDHDFLWRVHAHAPKQGHITVFNRSHYEDVLITRVHGLIDEKTCQQHYDDINNFEQLLRHSGTRILKFFLHISKEEQAQRLQARLDDPAKNWKFDPNDLKERAYWDDYQAAYEAALRNCSSEKAPWFVVPANHKWARDLAITEIVVAALEDMNPQPPEPDFDVKAQVIE
ncbi:polyphosphate kinase 2 family protein [Hymenobacter properus]|uniref:Polyphosphate kinase 2 family protein n=1 Tax=Hymenobacter properus TaxID=2791026 RepID=A0A931BKI0_9BACT|nr:polyphosphate kinase 2 family protein [Hymenobacter properus]MBF9141160.1 polyphosphate kinase 2 family protein [Hymenobacter properus]MBR7719969.1 polyphosphate kinase 2 family protein [Microvirga sp. SRT04]